MDWLLAWFTIITRVIFSRASRRVRQTFLPAFRSGTRDILLTCTTAVSLRNQVYGYEPVDEKSLPTLNSIEPKIRKEREQERQREQAARAAAAGKSPEQLEEEAGQEAAFNPETGEINWDCPCLGGMAHGPCGEEFKAAFSCFVYSNDEPKGIDCIEKFKFVFSGFFLPWYGVGADYDLTGACRIASVRTPMFTAPS